jgi:hypothetical protein
LFFRESLFILAKFSELGNCFFFSLKWLKIMCVFFWFSSRHNSRFFIFKIVRFLYWVRACCQTCEGI